MTEKFGFGGRKMKRLLMSKLADQIRGVSYKPEDLHAGLDTASVVLLRANNIDEGVINFDDVVYVDKSRVSTTQILRKGDILICASSGSRNLVGKAAQVDFDSYATFGAFCKVVRPIEIDAAYLGMFFQSPKYRREISSLAQGVNINNIKNDDIAGLLVSVCDQQEQQAVVNTLKAVQAIIAARKQELQRLDELIKARFVEMFGEPVSNSKRLPTKMGCELFKLSNGKFVPESKRFDTGIPAYGGNGISWYTDEILFHGDTIVVGRVGFQSGNVHLVNGPLWITDNAMYISDYKSNKITLVFLCELMEHINFTRYQDSGDLKKITQKPFMSMAFICPPLSMQEQFASFVSQVDKSKSVAQESLDKTRLLFDSLMQKYFG